MTPPREPSEYNTVSPYLIVDGADQTIRFLKQVFGTTEIVRIGDKDGRIQHSEVRIDDSIIMIADAPPEWPAQPAHVLVWVEDVRSTYDNALNAGAMSIQQPLQKGDDNERACVQDDGGTTWWISAMVGYPDSGS